MILKNEKICLVALLGVLVSGCDEYPGHLPRDPAKLSYAPIWGDGQGVTTGGDCHIDSINDEPGEGPLNHTVSKSGSALKVAGWGAISVKDGVMATHIAIALKPASADGVRLFASAAKEKRPDVAAYFKNPASADTGFRAEINLSDMPPGNYVLEVIQHRDGKNLKCPLTSDIAIVK